jgi:predicted metal-dependent hydrolase
MVYFPNMKKLGINTNNGELHYTLKRSKRVKHMRLTVGSGGDIVVVAPYYILIRDIENFIHAKRLWIENSIRIVRSRAKVLPGSEFDRPYFTSCRARALKVIRDRVKYYISKHDFSVRRVSVRDTTAQWGSCSVVGNLSFSYRLFFLGEELIDYVVVHELCHTVHMNHSAEFYDLVRSILPDYRRREVELKKYTLIDILNSR